MISEEQEKLAEKIYYSLSSQRFFDWYETTFEAHSQEGEPTKEEILKDIVDLFELD